MAEEDFIKKFALPIKVAIWGLALAFLASGISALLNLVASFPKL